MIRATLGSTAVIKRLSVIVLLALAPGCSVFWAEPDEVQLSPTVHVQAPEQEDKLREDLADHPEDLALRYALARKQEEQGLLEAASVNYGIVASELPRYTRPALALARVELTLGREPSAVRALRSVLAVVPEDDSFYATNSDYREAAVRLAPLLAKAERWSELDELHRRFTDVLGGDEEEWPVR